MDENWLQLFNFQLSKQLKNHSYEENINYSNLCSPCNSGM